MSDVKNKLDGQTECSKILVNLATEITEKKESKKKLKEC